MSLIASGSGGITFPDGTTQTTAASGGASWQAVQTANFTAVAGNAYPVNTTSAAITVTLPASPTAGQYLIITDYARTFGTNACTLNPNGNKISGSTSNVILNVNGESANIVYIDSTQGWIAYAGLISSPVANYSISYLIAAGGGGGGYDVGGGGGAGGLLTGTATLTLGTSYTISVGAGGAGSASSTALGTNGANSSISSVATSIGGGGGGGWDGTVTTNRNGASGGSGGGAVGYTATASGGSGTAGQGSAGGNNTLAIGNATGGGGGGASGAGSNSINNLTGWAAGGTGSTNNISGVSVTYCTGGRGAGDGVTGGVAGTANTGNGGDGMGSPSPGMNGGSGIVIISYAGAQRGTGGTVTTSGGNTIHTFTSSGTFTA